MAQGAANRMIVQGDHETQYAYRHLEDVVRRLANMPGQRVLVLVSPGFLTTTLQSEASDMVDRATRANIVINTIDARGPLRTGRYGGYCRSHRETPFEPPVTKPLIASRRNPRKRMFSHSWPMARAASSSTTATTWMQPCARRVRRRRFPTCLDFSAEPEH